MKPYPRSKILLKLESTFKRLARLAASDVPSDAREELFVAGRAAKRAISILKAHKKAQK